MAKKAISVAAVAHTTIVRCSYATRVSRRAHNLAVKSNGGVSSHALRITIKRWVKNNLLATLCALAATPISIPASADGGEGWVKLTTDKGCYLYKYTSTYGGMESNPNPGGYIWTAPCKSGQPINGEGTLYEQYHDPKFRIVRSYSGRIVNGLPDGPTRVLRYDVAADGKWSPSAGYVEHGVEILNYQRGCPQGTVSPEEWGCHPGSVKNPIVLRQVSPPHFPLPGAKLAGAESGPAAAASSAQGRIRIPIGSTYIQDPKISSRPVPTALPNGETLQGSNNLDCVIFRPSTGPNARSSLVNQCGEEVRLNYCLVYKAGQDNCAPMRTGWEATLWPVRAGQALSMPAADTLKLWSVFGCKVPLFPIYARFNGAMLTDGLCAEDGLAPPPAQAGQVQRIVRSNDPTTWPPGGTNKKCVQLSSQLRQGSTYLLQNCENDLNFYLCFVPNGSRFSGFACFSNVHSAPAPRLAHSGETIVLNPPNSYAAWVLFACDAPLVPKDLNFDGNEMTGFCKPLYDN